MLINKLLQVKLINPINLKGDATILNRQIYSIKSNIFYAPHLLDNNIPSCCELDTLIIFFDRKDEGLRLQILLICEVTLITSV
jgi:hypothetical protein